MESASATAAGALWLRSGDAWEWANAGEYPEKFSGLAFRVFINYITYAMTHSGASGASVWPTVNRFSLIPEMVVPGAGRECPSCGFFLNRNRGIMSTYRIVDGGSSCRSRLLSV